ncbi:hypothetical protein [Acidovorax radicis]|uniref:hypothetical protein n=1 Tax=Acidovorax radicis TaxID=758826 RepID=UPI0002377822|nr:hypothetical protein [Acidovorax radicis]
MVFFALNRCGYESFSKLNIWDFPLWVVDGVLSAEELTALRMQGMDVSGFNYALELDDIAGIQDALETIREHHPAQTVWVSN